MIGNLMKGILCLVALHLSFTTRILHSISETCLLALVKLTIGPLDIYAFFSCTVKLPISVNFSDFETFFKIEDIDAPKGFEYLSSCLCGQVTCRSQVNLADQCDQKWHIVHETISIVRNTFFFKF